jgi:hypothetical protein
MQCAIIIMQIRATHMLVVQLLSITIFIIQILEATPITVGALINNINVKVTLLPGVDEVTLKPDGSVRAYVIWSADFVNNAPKTDLKSYFSLKLNSDHKIYDHDEYFDVSGWFQVASAAPTK